VRQLLEEVGAEIKDESRSSMVFEIALGEKADRPNTSAVRRLLRAAAESASEILRGLAPPQSRRAPRDAD
jgi:hypothetical protein